MISCPLTGPSELCMLQENQPADEGGVEERGGGGATDTRFPSSSINRKRNIWGPVPPSPPLQRKNLPAANWISIFNQLATRRLCASAATPERVVLASRFTVETRAGLSAPLGENRESEAGNTHTHTQTHTHMETKRFGPAGVVITDGSNLFPLRGLEHQMVDVAGVALHHLEDSKEQNKSE